jgi:predicted phosphatase
MSKKIVIDPIPDEFATYEEAAEFWNTHDTADYPDAFRTVKTETKFRRRHYEVELDAEVVDSLQLAARQKGTTVSRLASDLLRQHLAASR